MVETIEKKPKKSFFKSRYWPVLLSGLIAPGLGQISNRDYGKGMFLLMASLGALFWFSRTLTNQLKYILPGQPENWGQDQPALKEAVKSLVESNPSLFLTFQLLMVTIWLFSMVDAYLGAKKK